MDNKDNNFFIVKIQQQNTKHHNGFIHHITMMTFSGKVVETYVDPKNRNYANWANIITGDKANKGYVLQGLQYRNGNFKQIDADSIPKCCVVYNNKDQMLDIINEHINYDPTKQIFYNLFDIQ